MIQPFHESGCLPCNDRTAVLAKKSAKSTMIVLVVKVRKNMSLVSEATWISGLPKHLVARADTTIKDSALAALVILRNGNNYLRFETRATKYLCQYWIWIWKVLENLGAQNDIKSLLQINSLGISTEEVNSV